MIGGAVESLIKRANRRAKGTSADLTGPVKAAGELERGTSHQAALAQLGQQALEGRALSLLMDEIVESLCDVLGTPIVAVLELEAQTRSLVARSIVGLPPGSPRRLSFSATDGIQALCDVPVVVDDWAGETRLRAPEALAVSGVCVSIAGRERPFGLLVLNATEPRSFLPDEIAFLEALAKLLADALERERVEEEIRHNALHVGITCADLASLTEATAIAERTLALLARPFAVGGGEHFVSASIGIAVAAAACREPEDLIREADAAMHRAKEPGQGRYELYDEEMRARSRARLQTENELRRERPKAEPLGLYVNLSLRQVASTDLAPMVACALADSGLDPRQSASR